MRFNEGYEIRQPGTETPDPCAAPYSRSLVLLVVGVAGEALVRWSRTSIERW